MFGFVGSDHHFSSLSKLEHFYLGHNESEIFLKQFPDTPLIQGLVGLNTCNRVEWYFSSHSVSEAQAFICHELAKFKKHNEPFEMSLGKSLSEAESIQHLFSVSAGLESLVLGENEILGQLKSAYTRSHELGKTDPLLNKIFQSAIAAGKRVRAESNINQGSYSISSIAIEAIRERVLDYFSKKILVVGLGDMGSKALKKLSALGHPDLHICNRTFYKAELMANTLSASALSLESLDQRLSEFDIQIYASSASQPLLTAEKILKHPQFQPTLLIDLGMPRNIDSTLGNRFPLLTVEGLRETSEKSMSKRLASLSIVKDLLKEEYERLCLWIQNRTVH